MKLGRFDLPLAAGPAAERRSVGRREAASETTHFQKELVAQVSQHHLKRLFLAAGLVHGMIGVVALFSPRWFFASVPFWPPLHVGQIQIAAVFDLSLAALFLVAARDVPRFLPITSLVGVVAEWGHAAVRVGHIVLGGNPARDLFLPALMFLFGAVLCAVGVGQLRARVAARRTP